MTEKQKRVAIIGGTLFLLVLLFLFLRRGGAAGNTIVNQSGLPASGGVSFGPVYYGDEPFTFDIPGLDLGGRDLSMVGACCSDCRQQSGPAFGGLVDGPTYVFNAGNQGPSVYNYFSETNSAPSSYVTTWGQNPLYQSSAYGPLSQALGYASGWH